jgi:hypothetical protein
LDVDLFKCASVVGAPERDRATEELVALVDDVDVRLPRAEPKPSAGLDDREQIIGVSERDDAAIPKHDRRRASSSCANIASDSALALPSSMRTRATDPSSRY